LLKLNLVVAWSGVSIYIFSNIYGGEQTESRVHGCMRCDASIIYKSIIAQRKKYGDQDTMLKNPNRCACVRAFVHVCRVREVTRDH